MRKHLLPSLDRSDGFDGHLLGDFTLHSTAKHSVGIFFVPRHVDHRHGRACTRSVDNLGLRPLQAIRCMVLLAGAIAPIVRVGG